MEDLVKQKEYLTGQLEFEEKRKQEVTPSCDQACKIQEQIYDSQVNITSEIYKMRLMMERINVIAADSLEFRKGLLDIVEKVC